MRKKIAAPVGWPTVRFKVGCHQMQSLKVSLALQGSASVLLPLFPYTTWQQERRQRFDGPGLQGEGGREIEPITFFFCLLHSSDIFGLQSNSAVPEKGFPFLNFVQFLVTVNMKYTTLLLGSHNKQILLCSPLQTGGGWWVSSFRLKQCTPERSPVSMWISPETEICQGIPSVTGSVIMRAGKVEASSHRCKHGAISLLPMDILYGEATTRNHLPGTDGIASIRCP